MAAQRYGGKYSPDGRGSPATAGGAAAAAVPQPAGPGGSACARG